MPDPDVRAPEASTETTPAVVVSSLGGGGAMAWLVRIVLGAAGLGLIVGFFLPWVRLGEVVSMSGFGLSVTGGQAASELAGPSSGLLFVVPLAGAAVLFSAIRGFRALAWVGLVAGFSIFAVGLYTLIRVFLDSTGAGMWLVSGSAIAATVVGLLSVRKRG